MKSNDKNTLSERICRALDIPADLLPGRTLIEMHGRSAIKICGGGAILLYSPAEIRISLKGEEGWIAVRGVALRCNSYNMGAVGIDGRIHSVSFESEECNEEKR